MRSRKKFVLDLSGYQFRLTQHALRMSQEKNFTVESIANTFKNPQKIYPSGSHPGQWRVTGDGLCLVGIPETGKSNENTIPYFTIITIYQDEILTPPRDDQLNTPEGRRYAERYLLGDGRG
jgi:hypothetical protein